MLEYGSKLDNLVLSNIYFYVIESHLLYKTLKYDFMLSDINDFNVEM